MIKVGIIGVTGYVGIELLRLLLKHPTVKITRIISESSAGQSLTKIYPHLKKTVKEDVCRHLDINDIVNHCDLIFLALPHGKAINIIPSLLNFGKKVIDLSADFRLRNPKTYENWYSHQAISSDSLSKEVVYGLAEGGYREMISESDFIANPGCYPTATILATLPALNSDVIDPYSCVFDAKSGISGAGRIPKLHTQYCEISENLAPYQIAGSHRHIPEIEQELSFFSNKNLTICFTPHLIPVVRGLLVTCYFKLIKTISKNELREIYQDFYKKDFFIRIYDEDEIPQIKFVKGTNFCDIGIYPDNRSKILIVVSTIDNLIKGASGQAIQNMNLMYKLPENIGLENIANYP